MPTGDQKEAKLFYAIGDGEWNEISGIQSQKSATPMTWKKPMISIHSKWEQNLSLL